MLVCVFFFQAEDGIRDLVRSRGLGDVYKRQVRRVFYDQGMADADCLRCHARADLKAEDGRPLTVCLLYTSDAADERSSVDLGGRRILKKKKQRKTA